MKKFRTGAELAKHRTTAKVAKHPPRPTTTSAKHLPDQEAETTTKHPPARRGRQSIRQNDADAAIIRLFMANEVSYVQERNHSALPCIAFAKDELDRCSHPAASREHRRDAAQRSRIPCRFPIAVRRASAVAFQIGRRELVLAGLSVASAPL
nr:unnamed protein product [Digitaria exilis]